MHKDTRSWLQVLLFSVAVVLLLLAVRRGYTSYAANNYDAVVTTYQEGNSRATKRAENVDWQDAAAHNLTVYKERLLQSIVKHGFRTPFNRTQWSLFRPVVTCPPGQPLTRYPKAPAVDGSKLLCSLDGVLHRDCVIYSLGSNGDYKFEQAMLNSTDCKIHTFDCTYNGSSQHPSRHFYHKWCVGPARTPRYRSWSNITKALGHSAVDVLKMDIESYEYSFLSELRPRDVSLPSQLAIEFHVGPGAKRWAKTDYPLTAAEIALAMMHVADVGYAAYSQEVNDYAPDCCSELSFMLLKGERPPSQSGLGR